MENEIKQLNDEIKELKKKPIDENITHELLELNTQFDIINEEIEIEKKKIIITLDDELYKLDEIYVYYLNMKKIFNLEINDKDIDEIKKFFDITENIKKLFNIKKIKFNSINILKKKIESKQLELELKQLELKKLELERSESESKNKKLKNLNREIKEIKQYLDNNKLEPTNSLYIKYLNLESDIYSKKLSLKNTETLSSILNKNSQLFVEFLNLIQPKTNIKKNEKNEKNTKQKFYIEELYKIDPKDSSFNLKDESFDINNQKHLNNVLIRLRAKGEEYINILTRLKDNLTKIDEEEIIIIIKNKIIKYQKKLKLLFKINKLKKLETIKQYLILLDVTINDNDFNYNGRTITTINKIEEDDEIVYRDQNNDLIDETNAIGELMTLYKIYKESKGGRYKKYLIRKNKMKKIILK